jgi:hypothetical protein
MRWVSLPVIAGLGVVVVRSGARDGGDPAAVAMPIAGTLLGIWLCFLFEDPASEITATSPTPLALRRAVRAGLALPAVGVVWFGMTWIGPLDGPSGPMAASFAVTVLVALGSAAVATRIVGPARAPMAAAAALVAAMFVTPVVLSLLLHRPGAVDPARPPLGDPVSYWASAGILAAAILGLAHLDPARSPIRSRLARHLVDGRGEPVAVRDPR